MGKVHLTILMLVCKWGRILIDKGLGKAKIWSDGMNLIKLGVF